MKTLKYSLLLSIVTLFGSCSSWLDVDMKDKVLEDKMFSNTEGFLKALNGVYVELVSPNLYGSDLSYGTIDVLAQYYSVKGNSNSSYYLYGNYDYNDEKAKTKFDQIWSTAYYLIANCNIILEHCADDKGVLPAGYKSLITGEALALRAMIHFDLLRLFGPIYSNDTKGDPSIPYMTTSVQENKSLESAEAISAKIIKDLSSAEQLLKNCDPVITEGVRNYPDDLGDNSMNYRQYRLNYFAVRGLLARANLWIGNKTEALRYATLIVKECSEVAGVENSKQLFPFVTFEEALHHNTPNRVFSSEVLFALYNMARASVYSQNYANTLQPFQILTFAGEGRMRELYDDENDYRRKMWEGDATHKLYFRKFEEVYNGDEVSMPFRYMMPLLRMSEMYLIAAETTDDIQYAGYCINKIRANRGAVDVEITQENRNEYIVKEFRKEMICEGQMFFFYKRNSFINIPNGATETGSMNIDLKNYVIPLPTSETSQREDSTKQ